MNIVVSLFPRRRRTENEPDIIGRRLATRKNRDEIRDENARDRTQPFLKSILVGREAQPYKGTPA